MKRQLLIGLCVLFPFAGLFLNAPTFQEGSEGALLHTIGFMIVLSAVNVWLALTLSWWIMWTDSTYRVFIEWLVFLPLFIPFLASLFGLYIVLAGVGLIGTHIGVAVAFLVATLPYSIRIAYNGMYVIGRPLLERAFLLPPWRRFFYVLFPLLARTIRTIILFTTVILLSQFALVQLIGAGLVPTVTTDLYQSYAGNNRALAFSNTWTLVLLPIFFYVALGGLGTWMVRLLKGRLQ